MTPERFGKLLGQPALLAGQNATELEELIGRYPWCGPLRRLRYEKALLNGDPAAIALWRSRAEPYLQRASRVERELRLGTASPAKAIPHFDFDPTDPPSESSGAPRQAPEAATAHADAPYERDLPLDLLAAAAVAADSVETAEWYLRRIGHDDMNSARLSPTPKESLDSYRAWKERRARASWRDLLSVASAKGGGKPGRTSAGAGSGGRKPEVASETLAELLAEQGHTDKAVRMYRQLALRYPTRRAAFEARIDQLQQTPA